MNEEYKNELDETIKEFKAVINKQKWDNELRTISETLLILVEQVTTQSDAVVSKIIAKKYALYCVLCYRDNLPLLVLEDYIKQFES